VWPSLPAVIARAEQIGFAWTSVSSPFVRRGWETDSGPSPGMPGARAAHGEAWFAGLMARGPLEVGDAPFMLPPLART
jgi:hypothetical protein